MQFLLLFLISMIRADASPLCDQVFGVADMENEVDGLTLGNTHEVYRGEGRLIRGHEPGKKVDELQKIGVTDVLIYKVERRNEVSREIEALKKIGIKEERIHHVDMDWQKIKNPEDACRETVGAINTLSKVATTRGRTGYFHCTAGQDRTGLLAGLLRMRLEGWTAQDAFFKEMCAHGYGFGDTKRPANVSGVVEKNLTPIFLQIAGQLMAGAGSRSELNPSLCAKPVQNPLPLTTFKCR